MVVREKKVCVNVNIIKIKRKVVNTAKKIEKKRRLRIISQEKEKGINDNVK